MLMRVQWKTGTVLLGIIAAGAAAVPLTVTATHAAEPAKPAISEEASTALLHMGQTLRAQQFSFQAKTIRVYAEANGEPLHIFHTLKMIVDRPSRAAAEVTGDDGEDKADLRRQDPHLVLRHGQEIR